MTDHWKDVDLAMCAVAGRHWPISELQLAISTARAKDAEAHAAELAAKDAEIARLRAQVEQDAHLRSVVELYRSDPMAMADSLWRMREEVGALRTRLEQLEPRPA